MDERWQIVKWRRGGRLGLKEDAAAALFAALIEAINWWETTQMMGKEAGRAISFSNSYEPSWYRSATAAIAKAGGREEN